ncbi:MAG: hypothetical protein IH587_10480, partial [Anaerolineae bacterium]|nr:hypothetical protein [Anaerolineae bacterium]
MGRRLILALLLAISIAVSLYPAAAQEQTDAQSEWQPVGINFYQSGQQALQDQDYDRVVLDASLFVLLNPTDSQGYFMRSIGYMGREDADAALADIETAIRFASEDAYPASYRANLLTLRANIFVAAANPDAALESYTQALDLDPTVQNYASRALLFAQQDSFDEALADIDEAVGLGGEQSPPYLHLLRGLLNTQKGDATAAAVDYFDYATLIGTDVREANPLVPNEPRQLEFAEGRVYLIPVTIDRPQQLSVIATPGQGSRVDPLVILLAPDGAPILANDDTSNNDPSALIENFQLTLTGRYTIVITYAGETTTG